MAVPVLGFMELPSLILPTITRRNTVSLFADTGRMERRANTSHVFMTWWDPSTAGSEGMLLPFRKLIKVVPRTREEDGDQSVPHQCLQLSRQFINNFTHFTFKSRSMSISMAFPAVVHFPISSLQAVKAYVIMISGVFWSQRFLLCRREAQIAMSKGEGCSLAS